jgi:MFS family permease
MAGAGAMGENSSNGIDAVRTRKVLALWATVLGSSVAMIDMTVINVALPAIGGGLGADAAGVQWTVNAFMLPLSALVLIGGALADAAGRNTSS